MNDLDTIDFLDRRFKEYCARHTIKCAECGGAMEYAGTHICTTDDGVRVCNALGQEIVREGWQIEQFSIPVLLICFRCADQLRGIFFGFPHSDSNY